MITEEQYKEAVAQRDAATQKVLALTKGILPFRSACMKSNLKSNRARKA